MRWAAAAQALHVLFWLGFHPQFEEVTTQSPQQLIASQLRGGFMRHPASASGRRSQVESSDPMARWHELDEQLREARSRFDERGDRRSTEIEVLVEATGALLDIDVVSSSGRAQLDALALEAVRQAVASRPPRAGSGRTRARLIVEATATISLPQAAPMIDLSGQPTGVMPPRNRFVLSMIADFTALTAALRSVFRDRPDILKTPPRPTARSAGAE